jgi:peptide/nickel transport system substrate-binding protein
MLSKNLSYVRMLLGVILALTMILSACQAATPAAVVTEPPVEEATQAPAPTQAPEEPVSKYNEAPALKEMVAIGELPPVEERLPENPLIVEPVESIGQYGGTWRRAFTGIKDFHAFGRQIYDPILRWPRDPKDAIQPGLADEWSWSADGTTMTLHLREGLKWSDGEPFTTADITFWWEDIENDPNITPSIHNEWIVNGKPMELEVVDDYTINLKFDGPNGLAERVGLAFHGNQWPLGFERFGFFAPRHYLEQFHPKYNKDLTDYTLFEEKSFDYNIERPVMTAWQITEWGPAATQLVATRNPFYWKVDPDGNQLPYIDKIVMGLFEDPQALNLQAINGDIDFQFRRMSLSNYPIFKENEEKNDYKILLWPDAVPSKIAYYFNQSIDDPGLREIFQNVKFRQAMSVSINRDEINEVSYLGLGTPRAFTVVPDSPYYDTSYENLWTEYNPDMANQMLDEIGLVKGTDGYRTRLDGSPLEIVVEGMEWDQASTDEMQLVVSYWNAVGIKSSLTLLNRDIYWPRAGANEVQVATWTESRAIDPMVDPIWVFPFDERSWMAPAYGTWFKSKGELGQEPTDEFKKAMDLYAEFQTSIDPVRQLEIAQELVKWNVENVMVIGTVGLQPNVVVVKNNFKNVPENFTTDWIYMAPGTLDPCHFYFDDAN